MPNPDLLARAENVVDKTKKGIEGAVAQRKRTKETAEERLTRIPDVKMTIAYKGDVKLGGLLRNFQFTNSFRGELERIGEVDSTAVPEDLSSDRVRDMMEKLEEVNPVGFVAVNIDDETAEKLIPDNYEFLKPQMREGSVVLANWEMSWVVGEDGENKTVRTLKAEPIEGGTAFGYTDESVPKIKFG